MIFSAVANALHVLAAVVWVGGMFFAHMALRPSVAFLEPPQRLELWNRVFPRFFGWVWGSVIILVTSGYAVVYVDYGGFGGAGVHIHVMQGLGLVMTVLFVFLVTVPYRRFRRRVAAGSWPEAAASQTVIRRIVGTNLVLGLATVAVATAGRFWG